jgi:formimidoylglutamase
MSPFPHLDPPGIVVNALKGDPHEHRAHRWLEWDGQGDLACALVGIPFDGASVVRTGSRHGPDAVRRALANYTTYSSSTGRLMSGMRTADVGDVQVVLTDMRGTFARVRETVAAMIGAGTVPVLIGGDHSTTWPILEGVTDEFAGRQVGIVHFDQHHDLREAHFGSESSGVPFRKALDFPGQPIRPRNLVQIGLGEFANSPIHAAYAREQGVTVISATEVFERGLDDVVTQALATAGDGTEAVYVSVDIDVVDQSQAPGTAAPNPYGLDARDLARALRRIGAAPGVIGLDVVEISPELEPLNVTGNTGAMLVLSFLAGCAERLDVTAPRG